MPASSEPVFRKNRYDSKNGETSDETKDGNSTTMEDKGIKFTYEVKEVIQNPTACDSQFTDPKLEIRATKEGESLQYGLTWIAVFPLTAKGLISLLEGYIAAITTPYLHEKFGMNVDEGSSYVFVLFISLVIGSAGAGYILQRGWLSNFRTMIAGGVLSTVGLFLTFPDKDWTALYSEVPTLAYVGNFLIGLGTQLIAIAALPALEETHVCIAQRIYTRKSKSQAASLWLIFWMLSANSGHLVALMVMEFLTYSQGGWLMMGFSAVSVIICVALEIIGKQFRRDI